MTQMRDFAQAKATFLASRLQPAELPQPTTPAEIIGYVYLRQHVSDPKRFAAIMLEALEAGGYEIVTAPSGRPQ